MRRRILAGAAIALIGAATFVVAAPAEAHVVPSTTIELDVHESYVTATLTLPETDLATASGIDLTSAGLSDSDEAAITEYLEEHFAVTSDAGDWTVSIADIGSTETEQWGSTPFEAVTAEATITPPTGVSPRAFTLDYDAIIHQVVTADVFAILHSDWETGELESSRSLGTITVDTVTGEIPPLTVSLDSGSAWQGFIGMVTLGVSHIAEGTDHQLFLLTLLLPAPLLAISRRWTGVAPTRRAVRGIAAITIAFTIGHSVTLALGALGLPVPQAPVEALIAVSIIIAAAHAIRPIFPGREPLIAGLFGLVHGMAFSTTLSSLSLSGVQLGLSLLGFNLGIEIMQLAVVALVLPPLLVLARTRVYRPLRITAAAVTTVAAVGWLIDRVGLANPVGAWADSLGEMSPFIAAGLWVAAVVTVFRRHHAAAAPLASTATRNEAAVSPGS